MGRYIGRNFWGIIILLQLGWTSPQVHSEPLNDLAQITQTLASQAQQIQNGDPVSDLIQAIVTIANVLNTSAPQINQFIKEADQFFPQAETFIGDFHEMLSYGQSWAAFSESFSKVANIVTKYAPETIPKINTALDSITNISRAIDQNSNQFMTGFDSASSAISTLGKPSFILGVVSGSIAIAWCLKYEELGKYVFTLDPKRCIFYQGASYCGRGLQSTLSWLQGRRPYRAPTEELDNLPRDLEVVLVHEPN